MRWTAAFALLLVAAAQDTKSVDGLSPDRKKGADSITPDDLRQHAEILASDEFEGRNAGCPGNDKAAEYIAKHFKDCGLKPGGENGTYFQTFLFPVRYFDPRTRPAKPEQAKTRNVIGILEGSDKKLKAEHVIIGAHYDHVGKDGQSDAGRSKRQRGEEGDDIWNGADDNGSGTVTLLEIVQAFAESGVKPKRSVVFVAFSAEEHGLYGSEWYADHPAMPLADATLMVNLDMVGRNEDKPVPAHGVGTAKDGALRKLVEDASASVELKTELIEVGDIKKADSDHHAFFKKEVPVMFFFTGLHADYHEKTDHADKLAYPNMARIGRATFLIAVEAAERKDKLRWNGPKTLGIQIGADLKADDAKKARLPDDQGGVGVADVTGGSVAAAAGMKKGDFIIAVGKAKISRKDPKGSLETALAAVEDGKPVTLVVLRGGRATSLKAVWK